MEQPTFLRKVQTKSVPQQIIDSLTEAMINRELRPGDKLPTEIELAESLAVGRNSVREAIKILECLGVLEIRRPEGTFVREGFSEKMIDPLVYGVILCQDDSYDQLMELRELMEVGVFRLAMKNREGLPALASKLEELHEEIRKGPENIEKAFERDNEFHDMISLMGNNPLVHKLNLVVRTLTYSLRYDSVKMMLDSGRGEELFQAHQQLYDMLEQETTKDLNEVVRGTYFVE